MSSDPSAETAPAASASWRDYLELGKPRVVALIVFTADQGFAWGQHGFRHKVAAYDANIRAPLIFSRPGKIPAGAVSETPVGGVDLIPTFFAAAGIEEQAPAGSADSRETAGPAEVPAPGMPGNPGASQGRAAHTEGEGGAWAPQAENHIAAQNDPGKPDRVQVSVKRSRGRALPK